MEGPSLVIACEEFSPFIGKKVKAASGTSKIDFSKIEGTVFRSAKSWGKHLLLTFGRGFTLRIHFLMFGSYRIGNPRENRIPRMKLGFNSPQKKEIYFYSAAIKTLDDDPAKIYDWSSDTMSDQWDPKKALKKIRSRPNAMVSDLLMDQNIFSGVGNIIKNEVLFRLRIHPETKLKSLSSRLQRELVKQAQVYSHQFYEWKKINQLKKNWKIFRKKKCPECGRRVIKKETGTSARLSHFCSKCQRLTSNKKKS